MIDLTPYTDAAKHTIDVLIPLVTSPYVVVGVIAGLTLRGAYDFLRWVGRRKNPPL